MRQPSSSWSALSLFPVARIIYHLILRQFLVCPSNGTFLVPYILLSNCAFSFILPAFISSTYLIGCFTPGYVNSFLSMCVSPSAHCRSLLQIHPSIHPSNLHFVSFRAHRTSLISPRFHSLNSRRILRDLVENPEHFPLTFDFALDIDTG